MNEPQTAAGRAWDWILRVSIPVLLAVIAWVMTIDRQVNSNSLTIKHIQATRFSAVDGSNLELRVIRAINERPAWLSADMLELKKRLDRIEVNLRAMETRKD